MPDNNKQFSTQLETAVLEYKRLACPNVDCDDMIVSREFILSKSRSRVDYWCRNPECEYHEKASIAKSVSDDEVQSPASSFLNLQLFQFFSLLTGILVFWLVFTSYKTSPDVHGPKKAKTELVKQDVPVKKTVNKE